MTDKKDSKIVNTELWVDEHGDVLFNYALSRLHNHALAEDVVQETFLAALRTLGRFAGRSSVRTWLIGILKHKIIDLIRKESREQSIEDINTIDVLEASFFDCNGRWCTAPLNWQVNPRKMLEQQEFMSILDNCLEHLPNRIRRIFILREMEGQSSDEICEHLAVSTANLWVMLYRARMRLQNCLSHNWFEPTKKEGKQC